MHSHPMADRSLAENEQVWLALSNEFDAAAHQLRGCVQAINGTETQLDQAALRQAKRRVNDVQSAMVTFLDALDGNGADHRPGLEITRPQAVPRGGVARSSGAR
jgi:hypothetical protein